MKTLESIAGLFVGSLGFILVIAFNILIAAAFVCFLIWLFTGYLPLFLS